MAVDDIYTKVLLHFDGANGSTTFADESGKVWTAAGNAKISTSRSVFGGASGYFDGNGDYISTPANADFGLGSNNFTFDFRFNTAALPTATPYQIYHIYNPSDPNDYFRITMWQSGGSYTFQLQEVINGSNSFSTNLNYESFSNATWYHIAFCRSGSNVYYFVNGVLKTTTACSTTFTYLTSSLFIGNDSGNGAPYYGYLDEFRFSNGIARWTSDFTPPTQPYPLLPGGVSAVYLSDFGFM